MKGNEICVVRRRANRIALTRIVDRHQIRRNGDCSMKTGRDQRLNQLIAGNEQDQEVGRENEIITAVQSMEEVGIEIGNETVTVGIDLGMMTTVAMIENNIVEVGVLHIMVVGRTGDMGGQEGATEVTNRGEAMGRPSSKWVEPRW